jgi:hypothetical protein
MVNGLGHGVMGWMVVGVYTSFLGLLFDAENVFPRAARRWLVGSTGSDQVNQLKS